MNYLCYGPYLKSATSLICSVETKCNIQYGRDKGGELKVYSCPF